MDRQFPEDQSATSSTSSLSEYGDTPISMIPPDWVLSRPVNPSIYQEQVYSFPQQPAGIQEGYCMDFGEHPEQIVPHSYATSSSLEPQVYITQNTLEPSGGEYFHPINGGSLAGGPSWDHNVWVNTIGGFADVGIRSDGVQAAVEDPLVEIMPRNDSWEVSRPASNTIPGPIRRTRPRISQLARQSPATFAGRESLRMAEGPWRCQYHPELTFVNKASWKRHMRQTKGHSAQSPWKCEACGSSLTRRDALSRHWKTCRSSAIDRR